jgi:signal transduction histidine kinase
MQRIMNRVIFLNIKLWQFLCAAVFYILFCCFYILTIYFTVNAWGYREIIIDYSLKAAFSLLIYWFIFYLGKRWKLYIRLSLHLLTIPLFITGWLWVYHFILGRMDATYLKGGEVWWDVYLSVLFYLIQFGVFHAYDYYTRYINELRNSNKVRELSLKAESDALKSQIQPHFLFNALNSISASVPKEMETTRTLIGQLADLFRFLLKAFEQESIAIQDELHFIKTYLSFEQRRFSDLLTVEYLIDDEVLGYRIPPMLLQPLIENAIKHAVQHSMEKIRLIISIRDRNDRIFFSIEDTGRGMGKTQPEDLFAKGIGLKNTSKRLQKQFNTVLSIISNTPTGVIVSFYLPKKNCL